MLRIEPPPLDASLPGPPFLRYLSASRHMLNVPTASISKTTKQQHTKKMFPLAIDKTQSEQKGGWEFTCSEPIGGQILSCGKEVSSGGVDENINLTEMVKSWFNDSSRILWLTNVTFKPNSLRDTCKQRERVDKLNKQSKKKRTFEELPESREIGDQRRRRRGLVCGDPWWRWKLHVCRTERRSRNRCRIRRRWWEQPCLWEHRAWTESPWSRFKRHDT